MGSFDRLEAQWVWITKARSPFRLESIVLVPSLHPGSNNQNTKTKQKKSVGAEGKSISFKLSGRERRRSTSQDRWTVSRQCVCVFVNLYTNLICLGVQTIQVYSVSPWWVVAKQDCWTTLLKQYVY